MATTGSAASTALTRLGALLPVNPPRLSDLQLISFIEQVEEAGRHLEALRLAAAGEIARRSDATAPDSLARRLGYKTPAQAIEAITKSTAAEARKLVIDATALAKLPAVQAAVFNGRIGRGAGAAIAGELKKVAAAVPAGLAGPDAGGAPGRDASGTEMGGEPEGDRVVDAEQLAAVEEQLVELATTATADHVRAKAQAIATELTPELVEAQAERVMANRYFWISPTTDGGARVSGFLPAGHAAVIRSTIDAYVNPRGKKSVAFADAETCEGADGAAATPVDTRTAGQHKADLLRDIFAAQARAAETPDMGADHPTVWLTTTAAELASGHGVAFYAGTEEPVPVAEAAQAACAGGTQLAVFGDDGRLLNLGRGVRGFTRRQRRAIAARDGGTCLIPDCTVPAQWCEVHHVTAYHDGGPTDAANGVNLCWFHHHEIDTGPWHIRMTDGTPEIRYAFGTNTSDWAPAGNGAAARIRAASDDRTLTGARHQSATADAAIERPPG